MALRQKVERRYGSVEQFAGDLRRYLDGLPVIARPDTFRYRTGKFLRRHKTGVAAAALVLLSLGGGLGAALHQARIASAQQARAERHFQEVRRLANSLLFEIYDSIQNLPSATPARKLILDRAMQYLDGLYKESAGDSALQRELAWGYQRLAQVQGDPAQGNLGDTGAMIASMHKAAALWEAVAKDHPGSLIDQLNGAFGHRLIAALPDTESERRAEIERAMQITAGLLRSNGANPKIRSERAIEYSVLAGIQQSSGDLPGALDSLQKGAAIRLDMLKNSPSYPHVRQASAINAVEIGETLAQLGRRREGLRSNQSGIAMFQELAKDPAEGRARRELAVASVRQASILMMDGNWAFALAGFERGLKIVETMAKDDPQNSRLQLDAAEFRLGAGTALLMERHYAKAGEAISHAIRSLKASATAAAQASNLEVPKALASGYVWSAELLAATGRHGEAVGACRKAIAMLERVLAENVDAQDRCLLASCYLKLGERLAASGQSNEAREAFQKGRALIEPLVSKRPEHVPARYVLADVYFRLGELAKHDWPEGRPWLERSLEEWRHIPNAGRVSPLSFTCGSPGDVEREVAPASQR